MVYALFNFPIVIVVYHVKYEKITEYSFIISVMYYATDLIHRKLGMSYNKLKLGKRVNANITLLLHKGIALLTNNDNNNNNLIISMIYVLKEHTMR